MTQVGDSKPRLMVVDDETDNLALLYRTFRRDFQVFKAESAFEALEILDREGEMAIIISDQRMPRMSGIEFLSRTVEAFPDTIRVILTGYTDVHDLVEAINNGKVFKYITKPWDAKELLAVVQQASETYRLLKQRTTELNRTLRRESLLNAVMTTIRESLDYRSMLQTIVETLGQTFAADACILHPVEQTSRDGAISTARLNLGEPSKSHKFHVLQETFCWMAADATEPESSHFPSQVDQAALLAAISDRQVHLSQMGTGSRSYNQLVIPLIYQQDVLAVLALYRCDSAPPWSLEDKALLMGVAEQAALAIAQAKLYQRIQEQTEQMRAELEVARQIQTNLLRQSLPELENLKIQACCYPAREVGGDFFEVYLHPLGDVWLAVGDVAGKGVPAALFMASAISVLRRELSQELPPSPDVILHNLNRSLSEDLVSSNRFITMVLARYQPSTQQLIYANAGHIYPLVWSHSQVVAQMSSELPSEPLEPQYLKARGVPLGILPVWQAAAGQQQMRSGDVLLLASDGITEASLGSSNNSASSSETTLMLRQSGLWQLLSQQPTLNLASILAQVRSLSPVQEDDQTILSLEVL